MRPMGDSYDPAGYREGLQAQTLREGLLFATLAAVATLAWISVAARLPRSTQLGGWQVAGLLPALVFLIGGFTLFRDSPTLTVPFHLATLTGVMTMVCGHFAALALGAQEPEPGWPTHAVVLPAVILLVYLFSAGARRFLWVAVAPPIVVLSAVVLRVGEHSPSAALPLVMIWICAAAGLAASVVDDRLLRDAFLLRRAEAVRREQTEHEIERLRARNERLARELKRHRAIELELERRAAMDDLTDTYNRRTGLDILTQSLYLAQRNKQPLSVCFVDVDDLKVINDRFGHAEGDRLLKHVITILRKHLRKSDFVARIGGDEFIMVLPDCSRESADYIMNRISADLGRDGAAHLPYRVSISMGIAEYIGDRTIDPASLIKEADANMYRHKQAKKGRSGRARS